MGVRKLKAQEIAKLDVHGEVYELPLVLGSEGERALDISQLRNQSGFVTLDPAYVNTAACQSAITFLDGENGILRYRGYPIEELAAKASFVEVAYLLLYGELPNAQELKAFNERIAKYATTDSFIKNMLTQYPKSTHPMGMLSAAMVSLSACYPELTSSDLTSEQIHELIAQIMAQMKNITAYAYRATQGLNLVDANPQLDYTSDFLQMMFNGKHSSEPEVVKALNVLLILHADHEQNCSTSTVRLVGSSKANLYASIASGVNALWGPLHGGANQAVIEMLEEIAQNGGDYKKFLNRAKDKNDSFKLMGFGHRVYKNFDPRAKIIKQACDTILSKLGIQDPLLDIAKGLEEEALKDQYFVQRKLYPNVDFYSGIIYKALNIPTNMFTVMFALGRLPGWLAQWKEMIEASDMKIGRPRQIYIGKTSRSYPK